jgi:hypothetical protein
VPTDLDPDKFTLCSDCNQRYTLLVELRQAAGDLAEIKVSLGLLLVLVGRKLKINPFGAEILDAYLESIGQGLDELKGSEPEPEPEPEKAEVLQDYTPLVSNYIPKYEPEPEAEKEAPSETYVD